MRLALTGFGNVGQGVARLMAERGAHYAQEYGVDLVLTGVADRGGFVVSSEGLDPVALLRAKQESGTVAAMADGVAGGTGEEMLRQCDAQVLLEAASTNFEDAEPGWTYVRTALEQGMDIVLASKGALVLYWDELMGAAAKRDRRVRFGGTVGAPLPIMELAERVLVGTEIRGFAGIVNATANLILEAMTDGATYDEAVVKAQEAGVAETDPTLDVDGWDAAAKAVIISRALFGVPIQLTDVRREGIRGVTGRDLEEARLAGSAVKLVARAERTGSAVVASVGPERRPLADPLGRLRGIAVGIQVDTDLLGPVTASIGDTGGLGTALTMLRDVVNLARDRGTAPQPGHPPR